MHFFEVAATVIVIGAVILGILYGLLMLSFSDKDKWR